MSCAVCQWLLFEKENYFSGRPRGESIFIGCAHVRTVDRDRLLRASVACTDVLEMLQGRPMRPPALTWSLIRLPLRKAVGLTSSSTEAQLGQLLWQS
jgi:hypothetical protein